MERTIDISEAIDQSKIGAFQTGIFILCALCLIMDGFDVQALGYLAPAISAPDPHRIGARKVVPVTSTQRSATERYRNGLKTNVCTTE